MQSQPRDPSNNGVLTAVEPQDGAAFASFITGAIFATETPDGASFNGLAPPLSATLAAVDTPDGAAFAGSGTPWGVLASDELPDVAHFVGELPATGILAAVDNPDGTSLFLGIVEPGPPPPPEPISLPLDPANLQGDIYIRWDNTNALGDWMLAEGDLQTGQDLETACLVSLFSDALATPDFTPTDGTTDRRGWWGNYYLSRPLGSNLWQLDRAKSTRANLGLAQSTAQACLQWLIDDGIAASIIVNTQYITPTMMGIAIAITEPDGTRSRFMFEWAWTGLAALPSPVRMIAPFG